MAFYLQMDGVDDYIITPSITYTDVIIDFIPHQAARSQYYADFRNASNTSPYVLHTSTNDQWAGCLVYVDGVQKTSTQGMQIPSDTRISLKISHGATPTTRTVNFCRRWTGVEYLKADIYTITFKNGATTVAIYDMSTQTVNDQSGNGNHATLTGGTWVDDGAGGGDPGTDVSYAYALKQSVYADRSAANSMAQSIYADRSYENPTNQAFYADRQAEFATKQAVYAERSWDFATMQQILGDYVSFSSSFLMKQIIYADRSIIAATRQRIYVDKTYSFLTKQRIYEIIYSELETIWTSKILAETVWSSPENLTTEWKNVSKSIVEEKKYAPE